MNYHLEEHIELKKHAAFKRSLRTRRGMEIRRLKGAWFGNAPTGYNKYRNNEGITLLTHSLEAYDLAQAFKRIASKNETIISCWLNWREKINPISLRAYKKMLTNRIYVGEIRIKANDGESFCWTKGRHRPIIDMATFEQVQIILREN